MQKTTRNLAPADEERSGFICFEALAAFAAVGPDEFLIAGKRPAGDGPGSSENTWCLG